MTVLVVSLAIVVCIFRICTCIERRDKNELEYNNTKLVMHSSLQENYSLAELKKQETGFLEAQTNLLSAKAWEERNKFFAQSYKGKYLSSPSKQG